MEYAFRSTSVLLGRTERPLKRTLSTVFRVFVLKKFPFVLIMTVPFKTVLQKKRTVKKRTYVVRYVLLSAFLL